MAVNSINQLNAAASTYGTQRDIPKAPDNTGMSLEDFYTLLAAQLKYQDPNSPMETSEMMASMVQSQMIQTITQMNAMNTTSYAASMVGKQVTIAQVDEFGMYTGDKIGTVTGVVLGDNPIIFVDGEGYYLNQIVAVGDVPKNEDGDGGADNDQKPTHPIEDPKQPEQKPAE